MLRLSFLLFSNALQMAVGSLGFPRQSLRLVLYFSRPGPLNPILWPRVLKPFLALGLFKTDWACVWMHRECFLQWRCMWKWLKPMYSPWDPNNLHFHNFWEFFRQPCGENTFPTPKTNKSTYCFLMECGKPHWSFVEGCGECKILCWG